MTLAVADALRRVTPETNDAVIKAGLIKSMRRLGKAYPGTGNGARFCDRLFVKNPKPYNSYGNGSAMRIASAAWLFDDLPTVRRMARFSAAVTTVTSLAVLSKS